MNSSFVFIFYNLHSFFTQYLIFIFICSVPVFLFPAPYSLPIVYLYCIVLVALLILVLIRKLSFVFFIIFLTVKHIFPILYIAIIYGYIIYYFLLLLLIILFSHFSISLKKKILNTLILYF